jgi:gluconate 5-dehydrogenase
MKNMFDVSDRVVLITGSSRGLGFAFASGFAEAGAKVIVNGTRSETVDPAVAEIRQGGGCAVGYPFDVTDAAQVERSVARIEHEVGPIEVLVNNAGIQRRAPLEEQTLADWRAVLEVNLNAVFVVSQCVGRRMIERRRGSIINITSLNAEGARPTIAPYCASKGGLTLFTQSLATEWGQYGIRANAIAPGYFITDLTQPLADDPAFDAWVKGNVPLARWGDPRELIGAAIFLASDASSYISGRTITIDGGWRASL